MSDTFACFGATCAVQADPAGVRRARAQLLEWHHRFSRFRPESELSRLNRDPRPAVPVSPVMARLVAAVIDAAERTGGLVDGTLAGEIEAAGYRRDLGAALPLALALRLAPRRRPARPNPAARRREIRVEDGVVHRPRGVMIDGGGLAKGLFADLIAADLAGDAGDAAGPGLVVDCAGDLRIAGPPRAVHVANPFGGPPVHTFTLGSAGIATSGIGRRSWLGPDGRPAHHLLDPASGRPAYTGIVQATAIAPTALEAEVLAKAAVLSGPERAGEWLPHGGAVVLDDGTPVVWSPPQTCRAWGIERSGR